MGGMWLWWILGGVLVLVALWLFKRMSEREETRPESPEAALKRRYARGEIDRAEYERRLADLRM